MSRLISGPFIPLKHLTFVLTFVIAKLEILPTVFKLAGRAELLRTEIGGFEGYFWGFSLRHLG